jgi:TM2 domain-containing membrane protein YozV
MFNSSHTGQAAAGARARESPEKPVFCSSCGSTLSSGMKFCGACGARVEAQGAAPAALAVGTPVASFTPGGVVSYGVDPRSGLAYSSRSKVVAGLLQLLIGGLGIGRFYMGHSGLGVAQILVTVFTCGFGALWGLVDGILILAGEPRDADGLPLRP